MNYRRNTLLTLAMALTIVALPYGLRAETDTKAIDDIAARTMALYSVPGMAVGIVKDNRVIFERGYGIRELGKKGQIDSETLFKVGSNSKAFTTAALAILVDEGNLNWDDKVIDHIPDFRLYDPWVTREFTVADLLTHRSGLAPHAGDMMLWPEPNAFTRADILHNLRYFEPASSFRSKYAYDNLFYIIAGELIPALTGQSWGEFVDERIFGALDADRCIAGRMSKRDMKNIAAPHGVIEGKLQVIERSRIVSEPNTSAAAGGIRCSLQDMLTWVQLQLNRGTTGSGDKLFSAEQSDAMWSPITILGVGSEAAERDRTHFRAYGLGWHLADVHGYREVSHTGSLSGWHSYSVLIPELQLGAVVLTNGSGGKARRAMMYSIVRPYLGIDDVDWIEYIENEDKEDGQPELTAAMEAPVLCATCETGRVLATLDTYAGVYRDRWFGDITVTLDGDGLSIAAEKSPRLIGRLEPYLGNTFIARWTDRSIEGDAYVTFAGDTPDTIDRILMRAVSSDSDFEFHDMKLMRVVED
jgi:CubicO group peptidase (beta-lactamase class C family)